MTEELCKQFSSEFHTADLWEAKALVSVLNSLKIQTTEVPEIYKILVYILSDYLRCSFEIGHYEKTCRMIRCLLERQYPEIADFIISALPDRRDAEGSYSFGVTLQTEAKSSSKPIKREAKAEESVVAKKPKQELKYYNYVPTPNLRTVIRAAPDGFSSQPAGIEDRLLPVMSKDSTQVLGYVPHPSSQLAQPPVLTGQRIVIRVDKNGKTSKQLVKVSTSNSAFTSPLAIRSVASGSTVLKPPFMIKTAVPESSLVKSSASAAVTSCSISANNLETTKVKVNSTPDDCNIEVNSTLDGAKVVANSTPEGAVVEASSTPDGAKDEVNSTPDGATVEANSIPSSAIVGNSTHNSAKVEINSTPDSAMFEVKSTPDFVGNDSTNIVASCSQGKEAVKHWSSNTAYQLQQTVYPNETSVTKDHDDDSSKVVNCSNAVRILNYNMNKINSEVKEEGESRSLECTLKTNDAPHSSLSIDLRNALKPDKSEENKVKDEAKQMSVVNQATGSYTSSIVKPRILTIPSTAIEKTISVDSKPTKIVTFLRTQGKIICSKPILQSINESSNTPKFPLIQVMNKPEMKPVSVMKLTKPMSNQNPLPGVLTTDMQQFANALASDTCSLVNPQKTHVSPRASEQQEPDRCFQPNIQVTEANIYGPDLNNNTLHNFEANELVSIAPEDKDDKSLVNVVDYSNESSPQLQVNHFQAQGGVAKQVQRSFEMIQNRLDLSNDLHTQQNVLHDLNATTTYAAHSPYGQRYCVQEMSSVTPLLSKIIGNNELQSSNDTESREYTGPNSADIKKRNYVTSTEEYSNCLQGMQKVIDNIPIEEPLNLSTTTVQKTMSPLYSTQTLAASALDNMSHSSVNSTSDQFKLSPFIPINYDSVSLLTNPSLITCKQQSPNCLPPSNQATLDNSFSVTNSGSAPIQYRTVTSKQQNLNFPASNLATLENDLSVTNSGSAQNQYHTVSMTNCRPAINLYQGSPSVNIGQSTDLYHNSPLTNAAQQSELSESGLMANTGQTTALYQNHPVGMMGIHDRSFERPQYLARLTSGIDTVPQRSSDIWGAKNITKKRSKRKVKPRSESD